MPSISKSEAIVLVFDAGESSLADPDFFTSSKQCLSRILERKILLHTSDHVCLVLVGTAESEENYENVSCPFDLQVPSLEMVRFVRNNLNAEPYASDWLDGVVLAADKLSSTSQKMKKIVVISNLSYEIDTKNCEMIVGHLKLLGTTLTFIGPNNLHEILEDENPSKRSKMTVNHEGVHDTNKQFLLELRNQIGDKLEISSMEHALQHLTQMPSKQTRSVAWNSELNIGDIKIPIAAYVKTKYESKKPTTRTKLMIADDKKTDEEAKGGVLKTEAKESFFRIMEKSFMDPEGEKVFVSNEETIKGVKYGNTLIPYSDEDKKAMSYKAGPKGISVLSFTPLAKLNRMFVMGSGCHVVVAPKGNHEASTAMSALIQALQKQERGAVARKVYSTDRGLRLVLLSPLREETCISGDVCYKECLVMNDLAWKEGVKQVTFPILNYTITDEQQAAVDALVDAKNLMNASKTLKGEPTEALKIENTREEKNLYYLHWLIERGVSMKSAVPKAPPLNSQLLNWPTEVIQKMEDVKIQFPITVVKDVKNEKKEFFRKRFLESLKEDEEDSLPDPPKIDFPKPVINENDPDCVRDIKTLFTDDILPPVKALFYILKNHLADSEEKSQILSTLKECIAQRHEFSLTTQFTKYNNWFTDLFETAPESQGIADFISSIKEPYGSIGNTESEQKADSQPDEVRSTQDIERSQLLTDIF